MPRIMLPRHNHTTRRMWGKSHARRQIPPFSGRFPRKIGIVPPSRLSPNRSFDTRRPGTSFQVKPRLWGEAWHRDAAGRAGSLRGPRRVFLCADSDLCPCRIIGPIRNLHLIVNQLDSWMGAVYKKESAKMPHSTQVFCSPRIGRSKRRFEFSELDLMSVRSAAAKSIAPLCA